MSDLDAAIRERISEREPIEEWPGFAYVAVQALLEVLKLHTESWVGLCEECTGQEDFQVWPCNTVEAIVRELGVSDD